MATSELGDGNKCTNMLIGVEALGPVWPVPVSQGLAGPPVQAVSKMSSFLGRAQTDMDRAKLEFLPQLQSSKSASCLVNLI